MANIKSAIKRIKLTRIRTERNRAIKSSVRTAVRKFENALSGKDPAKVVETLRAAMSRIDKAVTKGVIHPNTAARKKSRLARKAAAGTSQ